MDKQRTLIAAIASGTSLALPPGAAYWGSGLPSSRVIRNFIAIILVMLSLSGCDSERDKTWKKWRVESDKVDYRCGSYNGYEFKINRAYLFFWPTYEGRSDWEVQGPPPLSCSAPLETMPIEAYWPGLAPAANYSEESLAEPDRIHIDLNSILISGKPNLIFSLEYLFGKDWKKTLSYQKNKNSLGLDHTVGPSWSSREILADYYWLEESDGRISTFIECYAANSKKEASCRQTQHIPEMRAVITITYKKQKIKYWKLIASDVIGFIKERSELKRN